MNKEELIKQYKHNIDKKRTEILSALTALSIFITSTAYIIDKDRMDSKERFYKTQKHTYNDYYRTFNYHYEYDEEETDKFITIRKVTPWIIDGKEARRTLTIYRIKNISFDTLTYKGNYKKIVDNISYEVVKEYKYKNELRDYDRYEEPYFEVIETTQNKEDYIEKTKPISTETIVMLLSEIAIYLFVLKMNEGPLYETIIKDLSDISKSKTNIKKLKK